MTINPADFDRWRTTPPDHDDPTGECAQCGNAIWLAPDEQGHESEHIPGLYCDSHCRQKAETAAVGRLLTVEDVMRMLEYCALDSPVLIRTGGLIWAMESGEVKARTPYLKLRALSATQLGLIESTPWEEV